MSVAAHRAVGGAPREETQRISTGILVRDLVLFGFALGASLVLQRLAVSEIPPLWLVVFRLAAATAFFLPLLPAVCRGLRGGPRTFFHVTVLGVLNPAGSAVFSALALQFASSGLVGVLAALGPLISAVLGRLLPGGERLSWGRFAGLATAFLGVVLLIATRSTGLGTAVGGDLRGHFLALAVAFCLALAGVYTSRYLRTIDPVPTAAGQMAAGLLFMLPLALAEGEPVAIAEISLQAWLAVIFSGAFGLGAAFVLLAAMVKRHGPTGALFALNLTPIAAACLGVLLLGETVTLSMAGGAGLVLIGVFIFSRG